MKDNLYIFDSDCLSSFISSDCVYLLTSLYENKIYIPSQVYQELMHAPSYISDTLNELINKKQIIVTSIYYGSEEYREFLYLTKSSNNTMIIGKGEAAAISIVKINGGILASNNLKDISYYIKKYKLKAITTSDILVESYNKKIIDEKLGNKIWNDMLQNNKMPCKTFSEYLKNHFL